MILTKNTLTKKIGTNRHKNHNKFFDSERRACNALRVSIHEVHCMRVGHTKCTHEVHCMRVRANHTMRWRRSESKILL